MRQTADLVLGAVFQLAVQVAGRELPCHNLKLAEGYQNRVHYPLSNLQRQHGSDNHKNHNQTGASRSHDLAEPDRRFLFLLRHRAKLIHQLFHIVERGDTDCQDLLDRLIPVAGLRPLHDLISHRSPFLQGREILIIKGFLHHPGFFQGVKFGTDFLHPHRHLILIVLICTGITVQRHLTDAARSDIDVNLADLDRRIRSLSFIDVIAQVPVQIEQTPDTDDPGKNHQTNYDKIAIIQLLLHLHVFDSS